MKINPDCIKVIMLYLESNLVPGKSLSASDLMNSGLISSFSREDVDYSLIQLYKENMISCNIKKDIVGGLRIKVKDIEPKGHMFCSQLKKPDIWNKIKPQLEKIGTVMELSSALAAVASSISQVIPK